MAQEPEVSPAAGPPRSQPLGYAELVAEVPLIEDFLPPGEEVRLAPATERLEIAALEALPIEEPVVGYGSQREPEPEPVTASPLVHARVRDVPEAPVRPPPERPQNLVGRLGRRLGDPSAPATTSAPAAHFQPPPVTERADWSSLSRNRRAYRRSRLPAEIEIDDVPCTLIDVSIGGFAATGVPQIEPNALVSVTIRLVIDGIEVATQLSARIVYVTPARSAGRFIDLSPSQMAFLRYIVTWRGESVGAVGTTTLLDAISGGGNPRFAAGSGRRPDAEAKSRWWAGLIGKKINPPW
jgi:hypothetical protein